MKASPWTGYCSAHPDGRYRMSGHALRSFGIEHADRILDTELWGKPARILLLDMPLKLGEKSGPDEFALRRIRLHEVPGWPPKMASSPNVRTLPSLMDCTFREASYSDGNGPGQEGVDLVLEHQGKRFRAWLVGCPIPLLRCVEATLNQPGIAGRRMADIQDAGLVGAE